jgi:hypothetical protein
MFLNKKIQKSKEKQDKEQLLIHFYHMKFNLLTENLLSDPTPVNIRSAQRLVHSLDSHIYMFQETWIKKMSLTDIEEYLDKIDQLMD